MQQFFSRVKWKHILTTLGIILAVILLVDFNRRLENSNRLNTQLSTVQVEGTSVMKTQQALLTQVAYATSDEAVEEWAYVDGHWVKSGENPVVIVPAGNATPLPEQTNQPELPPFSPWQVWWELFFGS